MSGNSEKEKDGMVQIFGRSNPLKDRMGADFFENLPRQPGVYKLYSQVDTILYVGKAKNLRKRLLQYRRVSGNERKRARLVQATHNIDFEVFDSELEALLRENQLLRELKPQYNVAKTHPESYYFIGFSAEGRTLEFGLSMSYQPDRFDWIFGAFKGHRLVRSGLGGMLRQIWLMQHRVDSVFRLPPVLTKNLTADHFTLELKDDGTDEDVEAQIEEVRLFLKGEDKRIIERVNRIAREQGWLDEFIGKLILEDLQQMNTFFDRCLKRNYDMYREMKLESYCIPQNKLDDCLVRYAFWDDK